MAEKKLIYGDEGVTILSPEAFDDMFERGLNPQPNEYLRQEMFKYWEKHGLPEKRK